MPNRRTTAESRQDRDRDREHRRDRAQSEVAARERNRPRTRELADHETGQEGVAGEGDEERGTLPGSVGGTTGTSGRSGGVQAPGSSVPGVVGIDPDEAMRRRRKGRA